MLGKALLTAATGMMAGGEGLGVEDVFSTFLYTGTGGAQKISNGISLGPTFVLGKTYRKAFNKNDNGVTFTFTAQPGDVLVVHVTAGVVLNGNNTTITINGLQVSSASIFDPSLNYFYRTAITPVSGTVTYSVTTDAGFMDVAVFTVSPAVAGSTPSVSVQSNYALTSQDTYAVSSFASNGYAIAINVSREVFSTYVDPGFSVFTENANNLWATTINAIPGNGTTVPNATIKGLGTGFTDSVIVLNVANSGTSPVDDPGEGGLVWRKSRTQPSNSGFFHQLIDTERGSSQILFSNTTDAQTSAFPGLVRFDTDGFTMASGTGVANQVGDTYASWTFRKAPKFFDVVTYTGTGSTQSIAHNLGSVPGCIIVKNLNSAEAWAVYHRGIGEFDVLTLNSTAAESPNVSTYFDGAPNSTHFGVRTASEVNSNGVTYVAYVFAHDAGGFGDDGNQNVISCGSYTNNSSQAVEVNLGWEPQWVMIKNASGTGDWVVTDTMRGAAVTLSDTGGGTGPSLSANSSNAESSTGSIVKPTPTGFKLQYNVAANQNSGATTGTVTYIYIAIRRGPMKTPTAGTDVFNVVNTTQFTNGAVIPGPVVTDFLIAKQANAVNPARTLDRIRGANPTTASALYPSSTQAETNDNLWSFDQQNGVRYTQNLTIPNVNYLLRRAPGFFDIVAYTGTGSARTIAHNLGVAPELMIVKRRNLAEDWAVYTAPTGNQNRLILNLANASSASSNTWNNTSPTSSVFSVGTSVIVNGNTDTYIAYLFATLPGVSKVGSYTGTGATLNVDCGFTNGARFVLIKRTDSTGGWYLWDSARGINNGTDPYLFLNSSNAEIVGDDYIDPLASGFQIPGAAPGELNTNGGQYIFLAIA